MKRARVRQLVHEVLEAREAIPQRPVTIDTLQIDFQSRRVLFRGRTINVEADYLSIPIISTERVILLNGEHVDLEQ